ncbi:Uncharacterized protein ylbG (plasmid) [Erwinia pyrifoliae DSM 12163]|nr:Uncharacterized protein ylbG [Erwinia pyrifoliae DSM 12163]
MLHTNNPVIKHKTGLLNLAEKLSNVSKACKIMGVSRDPFYRYRELVDEGGVDALINRSRRAPNIKNRTDDATEQAVVDYAILGFWDSGILGFWDSGILGFWDSGILGFWQG